MPPQPLSRVLRRDTIIRLTDALKERRLLSVFVSEIIHIGALVEHTWSLVLVDLLRADPKTGVAMYQAITSAEARRAALLAAADSYLNLEDALLLRACMKSMAPVRTVRNMFAHHIWAYSDDLPDNLLLCDPGELLRVNVSAADANNTMAKTRIVTPIDGLDFSKIQVWKQSYFEEAIIDAEGALDAVRELETGLQFFGPGIGDATRKLLLARPLVAQARKALSK